MSKLAVANIIFETTESNRIEYTGNNVVRVRSNGGMQIPFGTTAQRASPEVGLIRYNTDTNTLETYETAGWLTMPTGQFISAVFGTTNVAFNTANAAFASANNVAPQVTPAYTTANLAYALSNTIYASVNSNWTVTNTVYGVANAAFASANNVAPQVTPAFNTANAAFAAANTKLSSSGGTISSDLVVTGNATFSGLTTYANTQTLLIGDNILTLNADLPVSVAATEDAGITVNRGLSGNASFIWDETTDEWDLRVNNNTIISIVATGNVGIGQTTTPERFGVFRDTDNSAEIGRAHIGFVGYNNFAGFSHVSLNAAGGYALLQSSTGQTFINSTTGSPIYFRNNNADRMILDASGNLGIGTTSPLSQFHVANNSYSYFTSSTSFSPQVYSWNQTADANGPYFILQKTRAASGVGAAVAVNDYLGTFMFRGYDTSGVAQNSSYITGRVTAVGASSVDSALNYLAAGSTGYHAFNVNAGEAMRITATGSVGIGITLPGFKFQVVGSSTSAQIYASSSDASMSRLGLSNSNRHWTISNYGTSFAPNGCFAIADETAGSVRMTIDTSGNMGVGIVPSNQKLRVHGGFQISSNAFLASSSSPGILSYEYPITRMYVGDATGYSFAFSSRTAGTTTDLVTIQDATGYVGIGKPTPGYKLDVAGTVNAASLLVNGGAVASLVASGVILENGQTISSNYTMTTNYNGLCAGPVTINTGVSVTIPTGSNWVIV